MPEELAANERRVKARRWNVRAGPQQRSVFMPIQFLLFQAAPESGKTPDRYQIAGAGITGKAFEICPEWSNDKLQSVFNEQVSEVEMDIELNG